METSTTVTGKIMPLMVKAFTFGTMVEFTMVNGKTTLCMARELTSGSMVECIMVSTNTTRNTDMVSTCGLMVVPTLETGLKVNKLMREFTFYQMEQSERELGKMEARVDGLILLMLKLNPTKKS